MKFTILNIANKMPSWIIDGSNEYLKRINNGKYSCNLIEIKALKNSNKDINLLLEEEAKRFSANIPKDSFVIALDEHGSDYCTVKLANKFLHLSQQNSHFTLVIGGANGLDAKFKAKCNMQLKLSSLTYPHALVRVIILEQIYRIITVIEKHPYHRE
jgi:23S rRNA (pseudouridine1915-N3)-methyltransferase